MFGIFGKRRLTTITTVEGVTYREARYEPLKPVPVFFGFLSSLLVLALIVHTAWFQYELPSLEAYLLLAISFSFYLGLSYVWHASSGRVESGWLQGRGRHPFIGLGIFAELVVVLDVFFWPGRLLAVGLLNPFRLLLGRSAEARVDQAELEAQTRQLRLDDAIATALKIDPPPKR
jgi:hypothetical protein